ncbi:PREDICTED: uncharacterized protein LOC105448733 [Wasmannia auropunctata]|uniref:uncharacterized protein LOC105448733 n=1 Tax=Wasmannia auropunctata TaxID=64793 RepID=UPI0005EF5960|nr:PREDICTED: uncharacterized protein LOC105448733 [Wasmannia auropunctata]
MKRRWHINGESPSNDIKRQLTADNRVCDRGYDDSTINHGNNIDKNIEKIIISLLFILSNGVLNSGSAKEHVHFKIHVPEIIKHHIHTTTVFIHIHKPDISPKKSKPKEEAPKKKKTYHKEAHHEDWSSWSNYGYHSDHDDQSGNLKNQKDHKDDDVHKEGQHGDMMGYHPPQYEVKEDVKEIDNNDIEPYIHTYEEGYRKGGESALGHTYSGDVTKFYDDKHEQGGHSVEDYKNESREKTHAGRYFVDDSEYQHNNKAENRLSPRIVARSRGNGRARIKIDRANNINSAFLSEKDKNKK